MLSVEMFVAAATFQMQPLFFIGIVPLKPYAPEAQGGLEKFKTEKKKFRSGDQPCCTKGFGISSNPSCGQISTTDVPLHTVNPKALVSSLSL